MANFGEALDDTTLAAEVSWSIGPNGLIRAIEVSEAGNTLYLGGSFTNVGTRLAEVDPTDGTAQAWAPTANDSVRAIVVGSGVIYLGGEFTTINGVARGHAAAVDTAGVLQAYNPNADADVTGLILRTSTLYLCGLFQNISATARRGFAATDLTGVLTAWNPGSVFPSGYYTETGESEGMVDVGDGIVIQGQFSYVGSTFRPGMSKVDYTNGVHVADWSLIASDLSLGPTVPDAFVAFGYDAAGANLWAAADHLCLFRPFASRYAYGSTVFRPEAQTVSISGQMTVFPVLPGMQFDPFPIVATQVTKLGSAIYAAGAFNDGSLGVDFGVNTTVRNGALWAFDTTTLEATAWAPTVTPLPGVGFPVGAIANDGANIYIGGAFTAVNGTARENLAGVNPAGTLTALSVTMVGTGGFSPGVAHIVLESGAAYISGGETLGGTFVFGTINGTARLGLAAVTVATSALTAWNPGASLGLEYGPLAIGPLGVYCYGTVSVLGNVYKLDKTSGVPDGTFILSFQSVWPFPWRGLLYNSVNSTLVAWSVTTLTNTFGPPYTDVSGVCSVNPTTGALVTDYLVQNVGGFPAAIDHVAIDTAGRIFVCGFNIASIGLPAGTPAQETNGLGQVAGAPVWGAGDKMSRCRRPLRLLTDDSYLYTFSGDSSGAEDLDSNVWGPGVDATAVTADVPAIYSFFSAAGVAVGAFGGDVDKVTHTIRVGSYAVVGGEDFSPVGGFVFRVNTTTGAIEGSAAVSGPVLATFFSGAS